MVTSGSGVIKQIKEDTATEDEFGLFLCPFADNQYYPTNPSGPTMFGYKKSEHPELVKEFFNFVTTTESLQEILDNSPVFTNLDVLGRKSGTATGSGRRGIYGKSDRRADEDTGITDRNKIHQ